MKRIMYTLLTAMSVCAIISLVGCKSGNVAISNNLNESGDDIDTRFDYQDSSIDSEFASGSAFLEDDFDIKEDENINIVDECIYNENGRIIIVMYHKFSENESDEWTRSFDNFYQDLTYLYELGYRSVSLNDYINNNINVPIGCTPIIFTFDDGNKGQFHLIRDENGELIANPKSAVGVMEKFNEEHPDFKLNGTFFINSTGFFAGEGTNAERLQYLIDKGFEIGNHTSTHVNFSGASVETIKKEVGTVSNLVRELTNGYEISALALPYGISSKEYKSYIASGDYNNEHYNNKVILLVGSSPVYSAKNENTNLLSLQRVRARGGNKAVDFDLYYWLDIMEKNPERKYERIS